MKLDFGSLQKLDLPLDKTLEEKFSYLISEKISKATDARKSEYIAGRICALRAAEELRLTLTEIKSGENREPIWPIYIVGSITHTRGIAYALLDSAESSISVGIDVETIIDENKLKTIKRMASTDKELSFLNFFSQKFKAFTILFSAKEALYKLIYPLATVFFGFKEAELVSLDLELGTFCLKIISEKPELLKFRRKYNGVFFEVDGRIITVLRLPCKK